MNNQVQQSNIETTYYLPCGPYPQSADGTNNYQDFWEVVWYGSTDEVGLNQNFMPCDNNPPPNQTWNVDFTEGTEYIRVRKYGSNIDAGFHLTGLTFADQNQYIIYFDQQEPIDSAVVSYQVYCPQTGCETVTHIIVVKPNYKLYAGADKSSLSYGEETSIYVDALNQCGSENPPLSNSNTYNAQIIFGSKYGLLKNDSTGEMDSIFTGLHHNNGSLNTLSFVANGIVPTKPDSVVIKFSTSNQQIEPINLVLDINLPAVEVTFVPDTVAPGDTAQISLMHRNTDGTLSPFNAGTTFDLNVFQGQQNGTLYSPQYGDTSNSFTGTNGNVSFIAADSVKNDSAQAVVEVIAYPGGGGISSSVNPALILNKSKTITGQTPPNNTNAATKTSNASQSIQKITGSKNVKKTSAGNSGEIGFGVITIKEQTILLGQSKYYQVGLGADGKLEIQEVKPGADGVPQLNGGIPSNDIWGSNPVQKVSGDKLGVYWETGKPVWKGDKQVAATLDPGLIRLVGRYWKEGTKYKVRLRAINGSDTVSTEIKVVKPGSLGTQHQKEKDVFGNTFNVDSLCIYSGGEIGVPPQIIKGHMEKETNFLNSFRYEPSRDITMQNNPSKKKKYLDSYPYYTVTKDGMGTVPMPDNHKNVKPVPYITSPIKIGEYLAENIHNYIRYPKRDKNGKWKEPFFVGYKNGAPSIQLQNKYHYARKILKQDRNKAMQYSIDLLKKWLKTDNFKDGKKYAQSRIFSSYGMLQQMFYFACTDKIAGYAVSNDKQTPESLNEIKYSIKAYKENMMKKIKNMPGNQWKDGYDGDWIKVLQSYNSGEKNYGESVIELSQQYLPK